MKKTKNKTNKNTIKTNASVKNKAKTPKRRPAKVIKDKLEDDNVYILKLVLCLIIGAQWIRFTKGAVALPVPVGAIIGVFLVRKEQLPTDRKIGYAILLISMFIAFWLPLGIVISL